MKKVLILLVTIVFGSILFAVNATASPLTLSPSQPVLMIDGTGDSDVDVWLGISDVSNNFNFGYMNSGSFVELIHWDQLVTSVPFTVAGGAIIDFAIQDKLVLDNITKLSDGSAEMVFSGDILAANSQNPVVLFDYWQNLTITWTSGNNDMVFNVFGANDGFAPGSSVPDADIMLLLGPALIGLGLISRKKMRFLHKR